MATVDVNTHELTIALSSVRQIETELMQASSATKQVACCQQLQSFFAEVPIPRLDFNIMDLGEQFRYNLSLDLEQHLKKGHAAAIEQMRLTTLQRQ